jgi:hypothetical protein
MQIIWQIFIWGLWKVWLNLQLRFDPSNIKLADNLLYTFIRQIIEII